MDDDCIVYSVVVSTAGDNKQKCAYLPCMPVWWDIMSVCFALGRRAGRWLKGKNKEEETELQ